MDAEWVGDKIIFVKFKNADEMARTVIRIGEYYEQRDKTFKHHKPSFRQFLRWYKDNLDTNPYKSYYQGLTIPGIYISHFVRDYKKKEYSIKEKQFIDLMASLISRKDLKRSIRYSVILCSEGKRSSVYRHEMAHCFAYIHKDFRKIINRLIKKVPQAEMNKMKKFLIKYEYEEQELEEEIYCRLIEKMSLNTLFRKVNLHIPKKLKAEFVKSFDDYYDKINT